MKFLRATVLLAVAVASAAVARADAGVPGARVAYEAGLLLESDESAELPANYFLRRGLQAGSGTGTTAPPPTTTAPPPTTTAPPPTTTAPPPTTTAPPPTTPPPTTTAPPTTTPPPTTPGPTTNAPETTTPAPTDKKDGSGTNSTTPPPTTAGPTTTKPPGDAGSVTSGGSEASEAGPKATPSPKKLTDSSSSGGGATSESGKSNKMSTGTIIGIVGGIVVGVGILAVIAVVLARKRREEDDDPLSPFELSMDKGYNGAAAGGYGGQTQQHQQPNANQYNQHQYGNGARPTNAAALGGAAAVGAAAGVGAGMMMTTDTPSAGADAAGVAYTQFYDPVTSPTSMYHQEQTHASDLASARTDPSNTGSNLWMSAMEPKENDVDGGATTGASVPPVVSLPEDLANNSSFVSRNSYDELPGTSVDIDQSSVLSGGSDLEKDFPDYEDGSSRGSYEL